MSARFVDYWESYGIPHDGKNIHASINFSY